MKTIKRGEIAPYGWCWRQHPFEGRQWVMRLPLWTSRRTGYMINTDEMVSGKWRRFVLVTFKKNPQHVDIRLAAGWDLLERA